VSDTFKEELRKAADEAVNKQLSGVTHHLRQAFYMGVEWEMERRRRETKNALEAAKADRSPS
jgi:hypothetical protein